MKYLVQFIFYALIFMYYLGPATMPPNDPKAKIRAYTRAIEFDYIDWTIDALAVKLSRMPLNTVDYLPIADQYQVVVDYIDLVGEIQLAEAHLTLIYTDPAIESPETKAVPIRQQLDDLYTRQEQVGPLAEAILQEMVSTTAAEIGFTLGGQPVPPVMYHSTPLPWALIVSPRETIEQEANISLETSLTVEDHILLEGEIADDLDVSTLVVPVGGVGTYPTMVARSTNLNWLVEVIAHEWIHNYLTLRPLGVRYNESPELRTMNETTANIAGDEIGAAVIEIYFPELAPEPTPEVEETEDSGEEEPQAETEPPAFDYRAEMHETRVTTDALLAEGKVEEAETYMEMRRQFFWDHGHQIRKLNQAYFAFYGAYADQPIGSAGEDPVGAAVRQLRAQSDTLIEFVQAISRVKSFAQLEDLLTS